MIELAVDSPEWIRYVTAHPRSQVYHHPSWTLLLSECYGFRPFALALPGATAFAGGLPVLEVSRLRQRRWVSQPFTDASPPLVDAESGPRLVAALEEALREEEIRRLEVRGAFPGMEDGRPASAVTHTVPLGDDPDAVLAGVSRHVRKNLRAGERAGLVVRRAESEQDLTETFYRLQLETRRRLGVPIQPKAWYRQLWRRLLEPGSGFLLLAHHGGSAVAGGVFLTWKETLTAKYSASSAASWGIRPNNAVFWEAMKWGCENGYRAFDFGRTDAVDAGLRRFKVSWGAVEEPLRYTTLGSRTQEGGRGVPGASLARGAVRHAPLVVTRTLGELFYRFAA
jgi:CelD/BcsL family acetyltransferase involved in cellulose biosynthesis